MKFINLHCHSHYSLLDGLSSPEAIIDRAVELKMPACAITDHGSISGCVKFYKAAKAKNIKPILGVEFYLSLQDATIKTQDNRSLSHQVVLAKNLAGWKQLMRLVSEANHEDNFYYKPRLGLERFAELCSGGNLISFSGHLGSWIANILTANNYDLKLAIDAAKTMKAIFGTANFFLEIQLIDSINNPECLKLAGALREVGKKTGLYCVSTADSHYARKEDVHDHRLLLCTNLKTTFSKIAQQGEDFGMKTFFKSDVFHIPCLEEMVMLHGHGGHLNEIDNTVVIANMCEDYDILCKPQLPKFECPNNDYDEHLRQLCRNGWKERGIARDNTQYIDRIKYELGVLQGANLSSYFLIVQDIVKYITNNGWMPPIGRGSAAGCLVSYLIGITQIDPLQYDLIFERFYNAGRNTEDHITLPDIDLDVPVHRRDQIIEYIKNKYGQDNVAQIITFGAMKGRSAIKDVLRAHDAVTFEEMNKITEHIPDESKISSDLQDMKKEYGTSSIIKWTLEHRSSKLKEWCYIDKKGNFQGKLAKMFEQAIRLENTLAMQGRHPAGVIVSQQNLSNVCPMVRDPKTKKQLVGFDMHDAEDIGLVKLDILGLALIDKTMGVKDILETGDIIEGDADG